MRRQRQPADPSGRDVEEAVLDPGECLGRCKACEFLTEEVLFGDVKIDQTAAEMSIGKTDQLQPAERPEPALSVPLKQFLFASFPRQPVGVSFRNPGSPHLSANELGAVATVVLLQPVCKHESRSVAVRIILDCAEEAEQFLRGPP